MIGGLDLTCPRGWARLQTARATSSHGAAGARPLRHGGLRRRPCGRPSCRASSSLAGIGLAWLLYPAARRDQEAFAAGRTSARWRATGSAAGASTGSTSYVFVRAVPVVRAREPRRPRRAAGRAASPGSTRAGWRGLSATQNGLRALYVAVAGLGRRRRRRCSWCCGEAAIAPARTSSSRPSRRRSPGCSAAAGPLLARWIGRGRHRRAARAARRRSGSRRPAPDGAFAATAPAPRPRPVRLDRPRQGAWVAAARHQLLPGRRRPQPDHARCSRFALGLLAVLVVVARASPSASASSTSCSSGRSAALAGVFLALDLFLFYFFFEMMLDPDVLPDRPVGPRAARLRGHQVLHLHPGRRPAHAGRHPRAVLHPRPRRPASTPSTTCSCWARTCRSATATWLMLGFFAAFAVKLPAVPLHTWLPDAHTEAPTAGSRRAGRPAHQDRRLRDDPLHGAAVPAGRLPRSAPVFMGLGVLGILYGAVLAFAQTRPQAPGRLHQREPHGLRAARHLRLEHAGPAGRGAARSSATPSPPARSSSSSALMQERIHTRDMDKMGGLWTIAPRHGRHGPVLRPGLARPARAGQLRRRVPHPASAPGR